jgi:hypothetical protein
MVNRALTTVAAKTVAWHSQSATPVPRRPSHPPSHFVAASDAFRDVNGATVKHQPESMSWINLSCVEDQVTPECRASPEARQALVEVRGVEPLTSAVRRFSHAAC